MNLCACVCLCVCLCMDAGMLVDGSLSVQFGQLDLKGLSQHRSMLNLPISAAVHEGKTAQVSEWKTTSALMGFDRLLYSAVGLTGAAGIIWSEGP